jgi:hypothetical protein
MRLARFGRARLGFLTGLNLLLGGHRNRFLLLARCLGAARARHGGDQKHPEPATRARHCVLTIQYCMCAGRGLFVPSRALIATAGRDAPETNR